MPQKVSPRAVRQLRPTTVDIDSVSSSSQANKSAKERSPKVTDRRSPRSPVIEVSILFQMIHSLQNFN